MPNYSATLNVMIKAARKAARSLLKDFGEVEHLQASTKSPGDFVSKADLRAEKIIRDDRAMSIAEPKIKIMRPVCFSLFCSLV